MSRLIAVVLLSSLAIVPSYASDAGQTTGALPSIPDGRTTVIGGVLREVDPVRDQLTLKVFGGRSMKILYDERTQVYRDGVKIPLRDLHPDGHASIQTVLDGTSVFAVSIHMLSQAPEGEVQGQVLNYNPTTGVLTVSDALSRQPIGLEVTAGTQVVHGTGAKSSTASGSPALVPGTLVDVKFSAAGKGRGVANQVNVLATPGSAFVFSGNVSFVDLHSGRLLLNDPRDDQNYQLSFDPGRLPAARDLHQGSHITVHADFDGSGYIARAITMN